MSDDVYGPEVVRIVRRYSAEVAEAMPNNTLAQAVTAVETENQEQDRQPETWRQWLRFGVPETDPDAMELQVHAREAAELWRKLKLNIESTELLEDGPPTIPTLLKAVDDAVVQWDKKREKGFGKAKSQFFSFLDTMEAHKYLFSVIPNGDKYTSLLTGIVTSVVKASTAHEQVAEGFSRALQEISKDLNFVRRGTQICNTPEVKRYVLALYSEVFAFLCHAMKWYSSSWNRFRKAFDGKFYGKHVEQTVLRIQKLVQRVHDEMKLGTDRTVQNIHTEQRMGFFETNRRIDRRFDEFGRDIDTKLDERLKAFSKLLGQQMRLTLMANAQHGGLRLEVDEHGAADHL
ncbi:hypothetical protein NOR_07756 [Metarhizium rileyi]|uniref:DUF7708 domain-containing protein n=1 Tax=Metarhizium rileyi (strain RCEF 4871) TaxID=1649241 RepID=A0A166XLL8_METRR|nr:hypothetical protein NOR_07756 [Metarhizium rileyi RCEF 4871]